MAHFNGGPFNFFGHLTRDPESFDTRNGNVGYRFGVAANYRNFGGDSDGDNDLTNFYNCTAFGVVGEQIYDKLRKGDYGWFSGNLKMREYTRRDDTPGTSLDVMVNDVHTNIELVRRDAGNGNDRDNDRDQDRGRGNDRGNDRDQDRGRSNDRDRDRDRGNDRDRDDDRGRDNDRGRSRGGRDDDRGRDNDRGRSQSRSRDDGRGRSNDDNPSYGNWSSQNPDADDLPF